MGIEERISLLEEENKKLQEAVEYLKCRTDDGFFTPEEVAQKMKCTTTHIYHLISRGVIETAARTGKNVRIPMSQFYKKEPRECVVEERKKRIKTGKEDMRKMIFG